MEAAKESHAPAAESGAERSSFVPGALFQRTAVEFGAEISRQLRPIALTVEKAAEVLCRIQPDDAPISDREMVAILWNCLPLVEGQALMEGAKAIAKEVAVRVAEARRSSYFARLEMEEAERVEAAASAS